MLFVGVDWAEAQHAAWLVDAAGPVRRRLTIPHSPAGLARLREAIAAVAGEPAAVVVAVERPDGLLVEALRTPATSCTRSTPRRSIGTANGRAWAAGRPSPPTPSCSAASS